MGLQVWLPLTKDLKNQGLSNVTVTNNGATFNSAGKLGGCYYFNRASSNYLKIDNPIATATNGVSMAFWVKLPSNGSVNDQLVHIGNGSGWTNNRFTCFVRGGNSTLIFSCGDGTNSTQYGCTSSSLTLNQWTHVVCIYNSNKMMVYLNGILDKEYNTAIVPSFANVAYIGIGAGPNVTEPATTYLNDVRIYDHALSPREVKEISKGLVLHYPLAMPGQENLLQGSRMDKNTTKNWEWYGVNNTINRKFDNDAYYFETNDTGTVNNSYCMRVDRNAIGVQVGDTLTVSMDIRGTIAGESYLQIMSTTPSSTNFWAYSTRGTNPCSFGNTIKEDVFQRYSLTFTLPESHSTNTYFYIFPSIGFNSHIWYRNVKLERGSIATPWIPNSADAEYSTLGFNDGIEYDVSGYGNNGTKVGTITYDSDTPRYNVSSVFNGTEQIKTTTPSAEILTLSCWAKTSKNKSTSQFIVADSTSGLCITFYSGCIISYFGSGNQGTGSKCTLGDAYRENDWNHFVVVKTGVGTRKIYCNGVEQTATSNDYWGSAAGFFVSGRNSSVTLPFYGKISDVRAYATALATDDILELYHTPISLSNNGTLLTQGEYVES